MSVWLQRPPPSTVDSGITARSQAGTTDDDRLDAAIAAAAALTTYGARRVVLTEQYVCNAGHAITADNITIKFAPGAQITLGPSPTGTLASAGRLFDLTGRTGVRIINPQVRPPASAYSWPGAENAVFYLANAVRCQIIGGYIDTTGVYTQLDSDTPQYVRPMDAVFVRGTSATDNIIDGVETHGTRITYAYSGVQRTTVRNCRVYASPHNGLSGLGNHATVYSEGCQVVDNLVVSPTRMGIEDWTKMRGTRITGNRILTPAAQGISAVGRGQLVADNALVDCGGATSSRTAIEVNANGTRVLNNRVRWPSIAGGVGVIVDGTPTDATDPEQDAKVAGNKIYGPTSGVKLAGNCQGVEVASNDIYDWSAYAIDATANGNTGGVRPANVHHNRLRQTTPSGSSARFAVQVGIPNSRVAKNVVQFTSAAGGGTGRDWFVLCSTGSAGTIVEENTFDAGGVTSPFVPKSGASGSSLTGFVFADNAHLNGAVLDTSAMTSPIVRAYAAAGGGGGGTGSPGVSAATAQTTVSNTTTETALGTYTIAAGSMAAGTTYRVRASGTIDNIATSGTLSLFVRLGGTAGSPVASLAIPTGAAAATGKLWLVDAHFTMRTVGSSATLAGGGLLSGALGANALTTTPTSRSGGPTVNSGNALDLVVDAAWATADPGNVIRCETFVVELVKA